MSRMSARNAWPKAAGLTVITATILAGCSVLDLRETPIAQEPSVTASAISQPTFSAKSVDPVEAESIYGKHHDPGLNVEWTLVGATYAPNGGASVNLYIKNLNDVAIPPDAVNSPKLKLIDYSGNETEVELLDEVTAGTPSGLDLPLGSGAKTSVSYVFNTSVGNLYSAELQAGNVIFKGSLIG
ncbi:hypothetical protein [Corynebacterium freiburgense]|uniref:hypothetical protein n=1 Tax=Corynebacterium freiburgense TaxID=556548 RepID=UPI0012EC4E97|nr:hypothetical protein [Corynebacterium freiburgense]WJZ03327.1 hypothetical protein CFREI_10265 [Corynebacterium freiburgense]